MRSLGLGPGSPKDLQGGPFQKDWPRGLGGPEWKRNGAEGTYLSYNFSTFLFLILLLPILFFFCYCPHSHSTASYFFLIFLFILFYFFKQAGEVLHFKGSLACQVVLPSPLSSTCSQNNFRMKLINNVHGESQPL